MKGWSSKHFIRAMLDVLFPPLCHGCRSFIPEAGTLHLCGNCLEKTTPVCSPICTVCGIPFRTDSGIDHMCGTCITSPRQFVGARAAVHFDGPVKELIHRLKYGKKVHLARPLGLMAAEALAPFVAQCGIDALVPVPLHTRRLRRRGFNQARLLADILSKSWNLPVSGDNLRRIRWTEPQVRLSIDDRVKNVRGAFAVQAPEDFDGKRLLLVDDVFTTGSTAAECAKVLKRSGAAGVYVATVARAVAD